MKTMRQIPLFLLLEWIIQFRKESDHASLLELVERVEEFLAIG